MEMMLIRLEVLETENPRLEAFLKRTFEWTKEHDLCPEFWVRLRAETTVLVSAAKKEGIPLTDAGYEIKGFISMMTNSALTFYPQHDVAKGKQ
jgi:hypothetical protein